MSSPTSCSARTAPSCSHEVCAARPKRFGALPFLGTRRNLPPVPPPPPSCPTASAACVARCCASSCVVTSVAMHSRVRHIDLCVCLVFAVVLDHHSDWPEAADPRQRDAHKMLGAAHVTRCARACRDPQAFALAYARCLASSHALRADPQVHESSRSHARCARAARERSRARALRARALRAPSYPTQLSMSYLEFSGDSTESSESLLAAGRAARAIL